MKKIIEGNVYNIPLATWYCETQEELNQILATQPAGTLIEYNGDSFKLLCVKSDGTYNEV